MAPRLNVIVASTRPARVGPAIARWFHGFAAEHGGFEPLLVDLVDFALPVFDEPEHPARRNYRHDHTKAWSASVKQADAFAFVTPEYNFFPPPSLVNALDFLLHEWGYAPAGIVSYGGISGGLRSAQALKLQLTALKMMPLPEGVTVSAVSQHIADGFFKPTEPHRLSAKTMLDELARWTDALKGLRAGQKS